MMCRDVRTAGILEEQGHRPWPVPGGPWIMAQAWCRLLFAHWRVDAAQLESRLPSGIVLDRFDGDAWLTVSPFACAVRPRGIPVVLPFEELNVRTYVVRDGRPGVWFLSLDATSVAAVLGARVAYALPYFPAHGRATADDGEVRYRVSAWRAPGRRADFEASYRPVSAVETARPGTLDHWLVERYRLYAVGRTGHIWHADIHHRPWPLQRAEGSVVARDLLIADDIDPPADTPLLHYAERLDVLVWPPRRNS